MNPATHGKLFVAACEALRAIQGITRAAAVETCRALNVEEGVAVVAAGNLPQKDPGARRKALADVLAAAHRRRQIEAATIAAAEAATNQRRREEQDAAEAEEADHLAALFAAEAVGEEAVGPQPEEETAEDLPPIDGPAPETEPDPEM